MISVTKIIGNLVDKRQLNLFGHIKIMLSNKISVMDAKINKN